MLGMMLRGFFPDSVGCMSPETSEKACANKSDVPTKLTQSKYH